MKNIVGRLKILMMTSLSRTSPLICLAFILVPLIITIVTESYDWKWYKIDRSLGVINGRVINKRFLCFTFDDGPDFRTTPLLLDYLDSYNIKAAFFINGHRLSSQEPDYMKNIETLAQIIKRGHIIGNHTFAHKDLRAVTQQEWEKEIILTELIVTQYLGLRLTFFRPPFGRITEEIKQWLYNRGYTIVMWDIDPLDWMCNTTEELIFRIKAALEKNPEGGIIVLHDTYRNTVESFPLLIKWLENYNHQLLTQGEEEYEIVSFERVLEYKFRK